MTQPIEDKYLDRVRNLLAKAEATEFPAEAELAMENALALMAKHGIKDAHLRAQDTEAEPIHEQMSITNPRASNKANLLNTIAKNLNCDMVHTSAKGTYVGTAHLFGFPDDIERVKFLYTSLLLQFQRALKQVEIPSWESPKSFRHGWAVGFINEISRRMRTARAVSEDEATTADPTTALVLADQSAAVQAKVLEEFPTTRNFRSSGSAAGARAGHTAGARADIGHKRVSGRRAIGS